MTKAHLSALKPILWISLMILLVRVGAAPLSATSCEDTTSKASQAARALIMRLALKDIPEEKRAEVEAQINAELDRRQAANAFREFSLSAVHLGGKGKYGQGMMGVANLGLQKAPGKDKIHHMRLESLLHIGAGARALALFALRNAPEARNPTAFQGAVAQILRVIGGKDEFTEYFGFTPSEFPARLNQIISATPGVETIYRANDVAFRELLGKDSAAYAAFAHDPGFLNWVYLTYVNPQFDSELQKLTEEDLKYRAEVGKPGVSFEELKKIVEENLSKNPHLATKVQALFNFDLKAINDAPRAVSMQDVANFYTKGQPDANQELQNLIKANLPPEVFGALMAEQKFQEALSFFIMGADDLASQLVTSVKELSLQSGKLPLGKDEIQLIGQSLVRVSKMQEVQRAYARIARPSVHAAFIGLQLEEAPTVERWGQPIGLYNFRPPQMITAELAAQFAPSLDGPKGQKANVLDIGYGLPAFLATYQITDSYRGNLVGVDLLPPLPVSKMPRISLLQGNLASDLKLTQEVSSKGPYRLITATDLFKKGNTRLGENFDPKVPNADYLKSLFNQLEEGGTLLIVNDSLEESFFSLDEVKAAGFEVVRWKVQRDLSAEEFKLFSIDPKDTVTRQGHFYYYVLRRGKLSQASFFAPRVAD